MWRRVARETELARPSMGALAERHWPPLRSNAAFGIDLDQLRHERTYRDLVPADDDFHDVELTERWWETETCWFSWNAPERNLGGWTYCQARPNANICNGGAWVWDHRAEVLLWELAYRAEYSGLELPSWYERDMRDYERPEGVHVQVLKPLTHACSDQLHRPWRTGSRPRLRGDHEAHPEPKWRGPAFEGHPLLSGGTRHGGDHLLRGGDPDRLLLGASPVPGPSSLGTPQAPP